MLSRVISRNSNHCLFLLCHLQHNSRQMVRSQRTSARVQLRDLEEPHAGCCSGSLRLEEGGPQRDVWEDASF